MSEDQKHMLWDATRACFWLLAAIIIGNMLFGFVVFAVCSWATFVGRLPVGTCKEFAPEIMELLVGGMAVVISFSGRDK